MSHITVAELAETTEVSAFLKGQPTFLPHGHVEIRLRDGSLAFAAEGQENTFVTVVQVAPSAAGWRVTRWEASGC